MARLLLILSLCISISSFSQSMLPAPDHIVIVIMENHSFAQIIGSADAPYLNSLAKSSHTALFTQSYAVAYPSLPNYLCLFSGCNQGVTDDTSPTTIPFTSDNLGRQLIDAGKTFISYAEDLPYPGFGDESSGLYVRRHNPAVFWMGEGPNQLPASVIQPLTAFPKDFNLLPTVCYVIPNNVNNMHDGTIAQGDSWLNTHFPGYIQWAKTNNSLLILTFDEDDKSQDNQIVTIFAGQMVKSGSYSQKINHYSILRTIEEMYGLPYACNASTAQPITGCWDITGLTPSKDTDNQISVYSNSTLQNIKIVISNDSLINDLKLSVMDIHGVKLKEVTFSSSVTTIPLYELSAGVYVYLITANKKTLQKGKMVITK